VVIQTAWFIVQCIARGVEHLPVTQLEVVTVALAILNFATYWLWWNKPLNMRCPVRVLAKSSSTFEGDVYIGDGEEEESKHTVWRTIKDVVESLVNALWDNGPLALWGSLVDMAGAHGNKFQPSSRQVTDFYAGELTDGEDVWILCIGALVGTIFGAVHCIAWSFQFQFHTEQILWRMSSLPIVCGPIAFFCVAWCGRVSEIHLEV